MLYLMAGFGPWSAATLSLIVTGRKELTGDWVAALAVVLGLPAAELAALTGTPPPERPPRTHPATPDIVDFLWTARSVSPTDLGRLVRRAHEIPHEYDDETPDRFFCHCSLYRGPRR